MVGSSTRNDAARKELEQIIIGAFNQHVAANGILAAGYRKPRTITTAEELDALPVETIIMEHACNDPIQRYSIGWCFGGDLVNNVSLPATVLFEGGADE